MEKLAGNTVISLKGFKDKGPDNLFKIHYKVKNLKRKCLHWVRVWYITGAYDVSVNVITFALIWLFSHVLVFLLN